MPLINKQQIRDDIKQLGISQREFCIHIDIDLWRLNWYLVE